MFGIGPSGPVLPDEEQEKEEVIEEVCPNKLCDCSELEEDDDLFRFNYDKDSIDNIDDLINLGKLYHCKKNTKYKGLDLKVISKLSDPLQKLNSMVGMVKVKNDIVNQIIFFLQGFNKKEVNDDQEENNGEMLHTIITGPPGVGKTELGKIFGQIYKNMGILSKGTMKIVKRSDLVGKYLGHTAAKTQKVIDEAEGGVLFLDEAYALGHYEKRDSFSKECIDTINQNLTERRDFLCIIAGYKDSLDECFFNYNEGLKRRFSFRYNIDKYCSEELKDIFLLKVKNEGWNFNKKKKNLEKLNNFFEENMKYFPHYGGDVETLFLNCKIVHSKRVILSSSEKKLLTIKDIKKGFESYLLDRRYKEDELKNSISSQAMMMYL